MESEIAIQSLVKKCMMPYLFIGNIKYKIFRKIMPIKFI